LTLRLGAPLCAGDCALFLVDPSTEETWRVMGKDFWAYGLEPNRPTLQAIGKYVCEQGLSPRVVSPDELFAADVQ
jgi:hypothetical protein